MSKQGGIQYRYRIDDERLLKVMAQYAGKSKAWIVLAMDDTVRHISALATGRYMRPSKGPHGNTLGTRTGRLARSLQGQHFFGKLAGGDAGGGMSEGVRILEIESDGSRYKATFGSRVPYANIHEFGGRINMKDKLLTIPLFDTVTTGNNGGVLANVPRARDDNNLVFIISKKGNKLLIDKTTGEPRYLLREYVDIPARPYLGPAVRDTEEPALEYFIKRHSQYAENTFRGRL